MLVVTVIDAEYHPPIVPQVEQFFQSLESRIPSTTDNFEAIPSYWFIKDCRRQTKTSKMSHINNMHNKHSFALFMPRVELCLTSSGITCITSSTTSIPSTLSPKYKKPTLSKYRWGHQAVNILYMNQAQNIIRSASPISTSSMSSMSSHHLHTASVRTSKVMQGTNVSVRWQVWNVDALSTCKHTLQLHYQLQLSSSLFLCCPQYPPLALLVQLSVFIVILLCMSNISYSTTIPSGPTMLGFSNIAHTGTTGRIYKLNTNMSTV